MMKRCRWNHLLLSLRKSAGIKDFSCMMRMSIFQIVAGKLIAFITAHAAGGDHKINKIMRQVLNADLST